MITCTRRLTFAAGHRVYGHESKCAHPHGHNYVVEVTAQSEAARGVDGIGRVIDFSVLKERIGGWLEERWDHGFLAHRDDPLCELLLSGDAKWKVVPLPFNPTAEEMARYILLTKCPVLLVDTDVTVVKVRIWETENCYAEATL